MVGLLLKAAQITILEYDFAYLFNVLGNHSSATPYR
jgi:hypothetical protein